MSNLNFQIITPPLTITTTSPTLFQNSKLVICSQELILKLKLKLDSNSNSKEEEFFDSNLLFDSPFFIYLKDFLNKVS